MRRLWILMGLVLLGAANIQAAQPSPAMILLRRENPEAWSSRYGNLYTYSPGGEAPIPLTTLGNVTAPALSPDGKTIAFAAITASIVAKARQGQYTFHPDHDDPLDIWLMDRGTLAFSLIAIQPPNQTAYRSSPMWSPDSQQVAWFTWDGTPAGGSLDIYDRITGEATRVASGLLMNKDDAGTFNLANEIGWGESIAHTVFRTGQDKPVLWLETIDPGGMAQKQVIAHTDYLPRITWLRHQNAWWVATQTMDDGWQLIQPSTHQQITLTSPPLLQLSDGTGTKLKPVSTAWEILIDGEAPISISYEGLVAIAPDGESVVHLRERKAFLWQRGQDIKPLLPGEAAGWEIITLLWTPMFWRA